MHAQWYDRESLAHPASASDCMREKRLHAITRHACNHRNFFRRRMDERGVKPEDIQTLEDECWEYPRRSGIERLQTAA